MKQIYKITYPTGKIYVGKDSVGSHRYFGSPNIDIINEDFQNLPDEIRKDYTIRKQILLESDDCSESEFLNAAVDELEQMGKDFGHLHLMGEWEGWSKNDTDIQVVNNKIWR